mgnify:CR=1 FL=1
MDLEQNHSERNKEVKKIKHHRKYEDRFNINASNIIQGVWDYIEKEAKGANKYISE